MSPPPGGRSRRLAALSLDDDASATHVVQRADKTVPLAVYGGGGSTAQGATPLPPSAQPSGAAAPSGNVGTTTAPLAAQSAPPAVSTPTPSGALSTPTPVSAAPTPSAPSTTGERAPISNRTSIDKADDEIEGPPMAKTPWLAIGLVMLVVVIIGVISAVVFGGGGGSKGPPAGTVPATSAG